MTPHFNSPCSSVDRACGGCAEGLGFESRYWLKTILFFLLLLFCKKKTEVIIYSFKPLPKVVVILYYADQ